MKNSLTLTVLAALAIVFGCAAEEMLPKAAGTGFPVLLSVVLATAPRRDWFSLAVFAVAAGGAEDAISSLPMMTSPVCFLGLAALVRKWELPPAVTFAAFPFYQLWLALWPSGVEGSLFVRMSVSLCTGTVTSWIVSRICLWVERKAAVDEAV